MPNFNRHWRMASYLQFLFFDLCNVSIITLVRESKKTDTKKIIRQFWSTSNKIVSFWWPKAATNNVLTPTVEFTCHTDSHT